MLILTQRPREDTILTLPSGEEIVIVVLGVDGLKVRLGYEAPDDVLIERRAVYERRTTVAT